MAAMDSLQPFWSEARRLEENQANCRRRLASNGLRTIMRRVVMGAELARNQVAINENASNYAVEEPQSGEKGVFSATITSFSTILLRDAKPQSGPRC
jgi:hypothetical protein